MENRQRRLIAAVILAGSLLLVGYLVFFTPSESEIPTPTPTASEAALPVSTPPPVSTESKENRTSESGAAQLESTQASDEKDESDEGREMADMPAWMGRVKSNPENSSCPDSAVRTIDVADADELTNALEAAHAGDRIVLAPGTYEGNFVLASSGEQGKRIWICGPRDAVIDSGGPKNGYGLQITGSHVGVWGLTVSNAQKGIVIDGGDFVQIDSIDVHTFGDEAIHFRGHATDGVVQDSLVHHTGLRRDKFGEGIYVGSAVSNWGKFSDGEPDMSDRIVILRNRIWDTTAESIDLKEGTSGGRIEFNSFDGSSLTGADSWVDVKGNGYVLRGNVGTTSPADGYQTHNIDDLGWGRENQFLGNTAQVSGPGYGFSIHDAEKTRNLVSCSNTVIDADAGFSNVSCSDPA